MRDSILIFYRRQWLPKSKFLLSPRSVLTIQVPVVYFCHPSSTFDGGVLVFCSAPRNDPRLGTNKFREILRVEFFPCGDCKPGVCSCRDQQKDGWQSNVREVKNQSTNEKT